MEIRLKEGRKDLDPYFTHSTNGQEVNFTTQVSLEKDKDVLHIAFFCAENPYTHQNTFTENNAPLYQQEVFEVFIAAGGDTPTRYWEIEINPNGAVWIGEIENLQPGLVPQRILGLHSPEDFGLVYSASAAQDSWSGKLALPLHRIGISDQYRLNFYRIRSRVSHLQPDWQCEAATCDFACWQSTHSGEEPAFHRPEHFGLLTL